MRPTTSSRARTAPSRDRALTLLVLAALVIGTSVLAPGFAPRARAEVPTVQQRTEDVVTADPLPTVQIDEGYVWAQTMIGDTVYAVGDFEDARAPLAAPGTQLTPRTNALAFDITTGELDPDWAPEVNGPVKAVAASPDGSRIYIGGSFSRVNGESRWGLAVLDAETGELVDGIRPAIGGTGVYALVVTEDTVYAGGLFTQANGTARRNLAAFSTRDGALRAWAPEPDHQVDAMVADPAGEDIVLGGRFLSLNGDTSLRGLAAVDDATGAVDEAWQLDDTVRISANATIRGKAGIFSLAADDGGVYGTAWVTGTIGGKFEGAFAGEAGTGELRWVSDCHGDHYGIFSTGRTVYATGHTYSCSTAGLNPAQSPTVVRHVEAYTAEARGTLGRNVAGYRNWAGTPAPAPYAWQPTFLNGTSSGLGQAALSVTGTEQYLSVAGEFVGVDNGRHQGIVRFATDPANGARQGPERSGEDWQATVVEAGPGDTRLTVPTNRDPDDLTLTYELHREDLEDPVDTVTDSSPWWRPGTVELTDTTPAPDGPRRYTVVVRDGDGNTVRSEPLIVEETGAISSYSAAVLADDPLLYYPLGDTAAGLADPAEAILGAGVSPIQNGIANSDTGASRLDGTAAATIAPDVAAGAAPQEFTTEVWVRTTSTRGGRLVGFGNRLTSASNRHDRHVYMTDEGRLIFGTWLNSPRYVQSPAPYNDGAWHHVVASQGPDGMVLTVDGEVVAEDPDVTSAYSETGYWRFSTDSIGGGWPDRPSGRALDGDLDEVAVYDHVLSPDRISAHHQLGRG